MLATEQLEPVRVSSILCRLGLAAQYFSTSMMPIMQGQSSVQPLMAIPVQGLKGSHAELDALWDPAGKSCCQLHVCLQSGMLVALLMPLSHKALPDTASWMLCSLH